MYTVVPPTHTVPPNRFTQRPDQRAVAESSDRDSAVALPALTLPAGALLEFHCCPTALWSADRAECLFNGATTALLGFCDRDFCADRELWLARVDARDRESFLSSWNALQNGATKIVCRYRFFPRDKDLGIDVEETALLFPAGPVGRAAVLSRYQASGHTQGKPRRDPRERSPVHALVHQIGNSLQAIRGEVDLLRMSGALPQRSFDNMTHGIDCIQNLVAQIDGLAAVEPCPDGLAGKGSPKGN